MSLIEIFIISYLFVGFIILVVAFGDFYIEGFPLNEDTTLFQIIKAILFAFFIGPACCIYWFVQLSFVCLVNLFNKERKLK
jgi:hypothetical protein